jgi:hypothetical protein
MNDLLSVGIQVFSVPTIVPLGVANAKIDS